MVQSPIVLSNHSRKKWKDSLETWAEPAILCVYVENQAILEPANYAEFCIVDAVEGVIS